MTQAPDPQKTDHPDADPENKDIFGDYDEPRPTAVLPGSDGTVTGTAVNDWLDDDGNPIYGKDEAPKVTE